MILWLLQGQGMMIPFPFNRVHGMIKAHSQGSSCWWSIPVCSQCARDVCPCTNPTLTGPWGGGAGRSGKWAYESLPRGTQEAYLLRFLSPVQIDTDSWRYWSIFFIVESQKDLYLWFSRKTCNIKPTFKVPWIQNVHSLQAQKACWEWINTLQVFFLTAPCPHIPPIIAPESSAMPHTP